MPAPTRFLALAALLVLFAPDRAATDATSRAAPARAYVAGIEDLPLMPGLEPVAGEAVVFDKPAGRIVQSVARGPVSAEGVLAFYDATVPQLGWAPLGPGRYAREGEVLGIDFPGGERPRDGLLAVRFTLSPQ